MDGVVPSPLRLPRLTVTRVDGRHPSLSATSGVDGVVLSLCGFRPTVKVILDDDFVKRKMAVFSKDAVAAALDQLCQTLDEAKGGMNLINHRCLAHN